ncbi:MAG: hypothetical protein R3C01_13535 [Planctomycetaceae bacterium]
MVTLCCPAAVLGQFARPSNTQTEVASPAETTSSDGNGRFLPRKWQDFKERIPTIRWRQDTPPSEPPRETSTPDTVSPIPTTLPPGIQASGQFVKRWKEGDTIVHLVRGDCRMQQENGAVTARQMVVWYTPGSPQTPGTVTAYLEGDVEVLRPDRRESLPAAFVELPTAGLDLQGTQTSEVTADIEDPVLERARKRRTLHRGELVQTQLVVPRSGPVLPGSTLPPAGYVPPSPAVVQPQRHLTIYPRYAGVGYSTQTRINTNTVPQQFVATVTGGVRIVVDGVPVDVGGQIALTTIDLSADRAVIWTDAARFGEFSNDFELSGDTPFEVYLEGDIVVRQGLNVVRASNAFYDLNEQRGLLWNAELRSQIPEAETTVRLRAEQVRQLSQNNFHAKNAWVTTSQMGLPGYRIEASDIFVGQRATPGKSRINPNTGLPEASRTWITSLNNRFLINELPVGGLPYLSSPVEDPEIPLRRLTAGYDNTFGFNVKSAWDAQALFGLDLPEGFDWEINGDYYSQRGPAVGTAVKYDTGYTLFGIPARTHGFADAYYINDSGTDRLGLGRKSLPVPDDDRLRLLYRNRTELPYNIWMDSEWGYLGDRNLLEQYWETEFDTGKDFENLFSLNQQVGNWTGSILFKDSVNSFNDQTSWYPRADLTVLSEPIPGTNLLWSTHSMLGYGHIRPGDAPFNPAQDPFQSFAPFDYIPEREGIVAMTRHEIAMPLNAGPFKIVPYGIGEVAYWQQAINGSDLTRLWGSAGVRGSVMFTKIMPDVYDPILGLNGLAHKMVFDFDYSFSDSSQPLNAIAQYNEFDEDSQERFRHRFLPLEFGGLIPAKFDPRNYAVRSGAGRSVTSPWHELVDDQQVLRLGWRNRWQTRVGPADSYRIQDWMTLDLEASLFPDANRDNFGETFGLLSGRYAWNLSPRTKFLANGVFDIFGSGQRVWNAGVLTQRGTRGSLYLGYRQVKAEPIDSQLLVASFTYHPSEKWVGTVGTSFDIAEGIDRGQSLTVTRVGEYALFHVGVGYDRSRNNFGVGFSFEPKFGNPQNSSTQLSSLPGFQR